MRICVLALAACGNPPAATLPAPSSGARPCDRAWWLTAVTTAKRAWLASTAPAEHHRSPELRGDAPYDHAPLAVLDTALDDAWLADLHGPVIVARWAPVSALARAITSDVLVSPAPAAPGDDSLRLLPGLRVAGDGAWLEVGDVDGIQLRGWIPATSTGPMWDEPTPTTTNAVLSSAVELHRAPTNASPIVAVVAAGTPATSHAEKGWHAITAIAPHAIASGYAKIAPVAHEQESPPPITGEPSTCLYDAPNGEAVGVVRGRLDAPPLPTDVAGWFSVDVATAFGDQRLFVDHLPRPRVEPD